MNKVDFCKRSYLLIMLNMLILLLTLYSCNSSSPSVDVLLQQSITAHGGLEKWNSISRITYRKSIILYDSLGNVEKRSTQQHTNWFKPSFEALMSWKEDAIHKKVRWTEDGVKVWYNAEEINDSIILEKYKKMILGAHYVFWQPYTLFKDEVKLSYTGQEHIDTTAVEVVKAIYPEINGNKAHTWWYYFDTNTKHLIGTMVYHPPTYSFIKNTMLEQETGLYLNRERKSYRVDSARNLKFLRASYRYEILDWE